MAHGYEIAIASAGCKAEFVKTFLQRRVAPDSACLPRICHNNGNGRSKATASALS